MVADVPMHDRAHSPRSTIKKRKRISDQHLPAPTTARQHQRKSSLNNRTFSINTRRSLDFARPADLEQRCYDWIIQPKGVHYARNRSWFTEYTPVNLQLASGLWCQGVGSVRLDVRIHNHNPPFSPAAAATAAATAQDGPGFATVLLRDVLHLPKAVCNGFSLAVLPHLSLTHPDCPNGGLRDSSSGGILLLNGLRGLSRLSLLGEQVGESPLEELVEDDVPGKLLDLGLCLSEVDISRIKDIVAPGGR